MNPLKTSKPARLRWKTLLAAMALTTAIASYVIYTFLPVDRLEVERGLTVFAGRPPPPEVESQELDVADELRNETASKPAAVMKMRQSAQVALGSAGSRLACAEASMMCPAPQISGPMDMAWRCNPNFNTEAYDAIVDNAFLKAKQNPLSTFSIDVDTASYSNTRRFLNSGSLPPKDSVRIEELINYFTYNYEPPKDDKPFAVHTEVGACPWNAERQLVRIGLKGKEIALDNRPKSNLVFLIDVSGSMGEPNKLPLVKSGLQLLARQLNGNDRVSMVVYAGSSGLVLPSTACDEKKKVLDAIDNLEAGGSTNGGQGIELAYKIAQQNFIKGGVNRVILCTDGDFNVGVTNEGDLTRLIEEKAKSGVFLSVLGFGMGNYKDSNLEKLADKGNGNYAYIDTLQEARKVLVEQMSGTLITIAKDVKIQVEFNPARVAAYRLVGYENRMLKKEDFNDDKKDAGEIGAGHTVTALYEIVPAGKKISLPSVDPLKYQKAASAIVEDESSRDLLTVKLRYKKPDGDKSALLEFPVAAGDVGKGSDDFRFAAAVASFGMVLRESEHKGSATLDTVLALARESKGSDPDGYRGEFVNLVKMAQALRKS